MPLAAADSLCYPLTGEECLTVAAHTPVSIEAPVVPGQVIGEACAYLDGIEVARVDLVAAAPSALLPQEKEESGWLGRVFNPMRRRLNPPYLPRWSNAPPRRDRWGWQNVSGPFAAFALSRSSARQSFVRKTLCWALLTSALTCQAGAVGTSAASAVLIEQESGRVLYGDFQKVAVQQISSTAGSSFFFT